MSRIMECLQKDLGCGVCRCFPFHGCICCVRHGAHQYLKSNGRSIDRYTDYSFVAAPEASDNAKLSGFEVEWLPEGFTLTDESTHSSWVDARYEGPRGEILDIALHTLGESGTVTADTEDALVEDITINGRAATFITKDYYQVVMPIEEKQQLLCVAYWSETDPSTKELLIRIVENISLFHQVGQ